MTPRSAVTIITVLVVPSLVVFIASLLLWLGVVPSSEIDAITGSKSRDPAGISIFDGAGSSADCAGGICPSAATAAMTALHEFYNPLTGLLNTTSWWNTANVLETTMDYAKLTEDHSFDRAISNTFEKYKYIEFLNPWYYDDEGWWALTWIKAYDATGEQHYLEMAKTIFEDMKQGWDATCGGGIWWLKRREYKNAITNELFLAVAARLHLRVPNDTGPNSYLGWAQREWKWFKDRQLINKLNLVNDGLNGSCENNQEMVWTYNQGVILGGLLDLYEATKDSSLLNQARAIADATTTVLAPDGVLQEWCEPSNCKVDSAQFKGIFMRNLSYLYQVTRKPAYKEFITENASSIWRRNRNHSNQFGLVWKGPFDRADAIRQSSAMDAINAALAVRLGETTESPKPSGR